MKQPQSFLLGVLLGGGIMALLTSLAWDMHCKTHRAETRELLIERQEQSATIAMLERQGARKRGK